jgi:excisionase family DNA binding protein
MSGFSGLSSLNPANTDALANQLVSNLMREVLGEVVASARQDVNVILERVTREALLDVMLFSVVDVASILNMGRHKVEYFIRSKQLKARRYGNEYRVRHSDLFEFVRETQPALMPELDRAARKRVNENSRLEPKEKENGLEAHPTLRALQETPPETGVKG